MATSLIDSVVDTVTSAVQNIDTGQLQKITGQRIDSVEEFMQRTGSVRTTNYGRGFLAGVLGGIVAVGVKMIVDHYVAPGVEQAEDRLAEDMVDAAEGMTGINLTADQQDAAEAIVEVGMGALIGGVYGLMIEALPNRQEVSTENANLLTTAKSLAGPALGMIPKATKAVSQKHVESLAGNAAFGATLEIVRRTARYYMEEG